MLRTQSFQTYCGYDTALVVSIGVAVALLKFAGVTISDERLSVLVPTDVIIRRLYATVQQEDITLEDDLIGGRRQLQ